MASYTRVHLSGSTDGLPINVTGTATGSSNTVHTAVAGSVNFDELYLWVSNLHTADVSLTVEWGSATDPGGLLMKTVVIPALSPPTPFAFGQVLNNAKVVKVFASTTAVLNITGFINRIA